MKRCAGNILTQSISCFDNPEIQLKYNRIPFYTKIASGKFPITQVVAPVYPGFYDVILPVNLRLLFLLTVGIGTWGQ